MENNMNQQLTLWRAFMKEWITEHTYPDYRKMLTPTFSDFMEWCSEHCDENGNLKENV
jgi:hypothetical protein